MRRLSWLVPLLIGLSACRHAAPAPGPGDDAGSPQVLAQLEQDTGRPWTVRWHPDLPTAAFLEGDSPPWALSASQAERVGRAFLMRYPGLFGLGSDDDLAIDSAGVDELGMIHVSYLQRKGHVPVRGGQLRVHFAANGALIRVNGRSIPIGPITLVPNHSDDEAEAAALLDARSLRAELDASAFSSARPELWIWPRGAYDARLAWRVSIDVQDGKQPMALVTFVDANDGSILERTDTLSTLEGSGTGVFGDQQRLVITEKSGAFWLEDATRGTSPDQKTYSAGGRAHLPGSGVRSDDPTRWDLAGAAAGAAVDAHAYVARAWDYFRDVHGRSGWDGQSHGVHATVHFGDHYAGAFYDGRQLVFGDGDADLSPPAGAFDVVAHEYTHGLTAATAQLEHTGETGALDEAIADLFGCLASAGTVRGGDWQIGGSIYHPAGQSRPLRDLANPHTTGNPSTLAEWVTTSEDNAGVHLNSTIVSHAAFLMSEGGPGVTALGGVATSRIWYRALTRYLTSQARFADAADATVAAARDFGRGEEASVRSAWIAAGVLKE